MSRLTVVNVAFPFAPVTADPVGGAEQVIACLDRALIEAGHRSIVIAAEGSSPVGEFVAVPQPKDHIAQGDWVRAHDYLRALLPELLRKAGADLLHMHGTDYVHYLPPPGLPVLATLHMPLSYYEPAALDPARPRTWLNTVSQHQHKQLQTAALSHLLGTVENGIRIAADHRPSHKEGYALALGRICPEKGFHLAIDAAKAAGVRLLLAGRVFPHPEHETYFETEIAPRLDGERRWIGAVSGARKWRLLQDARCLLVSSLVPETASLVAREALAAGTPVVAFPNGALADIVEPGRTGFLVHDVAEMADAIRRCDEIDPETCRRTAHDRFSASRMVREYLGLYKHLVQAA